MRHWKALICVCLLAAGLMLTASGCERAVAEPSTTSISTTSTSNGPGRVDDGNQASSARGPELFPALGPGGYGFIDSSGRLVFDYKYFLAREFSDGLAAVDVKGDGQWGYIDESEELVIEPSTGGWPFSEGLAAVSTSQGWGYIDKTGDFVIGPESSWIFAGEFGEGLAPIEDSEGLAYIDRDGQVVFRLPNGVHGGSFSEGMAFVETNTEWLGYIDKTGQFVIEPRYGYATDFSNGLAVVGYSIGNYVIIDTGGRITKRLDCEQAFGLGEGRAPVSVRVEVRESADETATELRWGFIDETGTLVIPAMFNSATQFSGGLAWVTDENGIEGYVDRDGDYVWRAE